LALQAKEAWQPPESCPEDMSLAKGIYKYATMNIDIIY